MWLASKEKLSFYRGYDSSKIVSAKSRCEQIENSQQGKKKRKM